MSTPAGWYDDGQGSLRWWDGTQWTQHTQAKPDAAPVPTPAPAAPSFDDTSSNPVPDAEPVAAEPVVPEPAAAEPVDTAPDALDDALTPSEPAPATPSFDQPATTPAPSFEPPASATAPAAASVPPPAAPAPSVSPASTPQPTAPYAAAAPTAATQPYGGQLPQPYAQAGYGQQPAYAQQAPYGQQAGYAQQPTYTQQPYGGQPSNLYGGQPPAQKKSKLWIVFVVIGVVLIGLIVAAALIIPRLLGGGGSNGGGTTGVTGSTPDEKAAVAAVVLYDDAYDTANCDEYNKATTDNYRSNYGFTSCSDFQDQSKSFSSTVSNYQIDVTKVTTSSDGATITVDTMETYLSKVDTNGNTLSTPEPYEDDYTYTLVKQNGTWAIDDLQ